MMADMFGALWTNSHGIKPDERNVWAAALSGLDEQQIKKGLGVLTKSGREFPPSAPVFRKMCVDKTREEIEAKHRQDIIKQEKELPKPLNREKGKAAAKAMKKHLGKPDFEERMNSEFDDIFGGKLV